MAETKFEIGDLIENRYRVLDVIGTGGMGTLYRVSDEAREGEVVALKTVRLRGAAAEAPENVERFQREFQLLTQLRHPNLVSVYNYGITTEGELYFTMEWVEGGDLEPSLRPLEPGATIPVVVQVCRALAYLHARGVIHGDLKPHNVLMAGDASDGGHRVKLVDFGVAFEVKSPEDRARYYTPGYTAPEARKPHPLDQRADLYSLGAMWYALLVGEPPMFLPGPGMERLVKFALDETLQAQEQIPTKIGAVIARLMATLPDDRYRSANEVIEAVNQITGSLYALETRETARSYALRGRFVNREPEMETLWSAWKQAKSDEGKLVLIGGEAGVGKTRLLEEFVVQAELEGARVARGQCVEGGGIAYRPWREVLRVLMRYVEGAGDAELERIGPVLATLLPELWERDYMADAEPPAILEPQAARLRLNGAIAQVLQTAAGLRPTVVVIEDGHWADEATLELLNFLTRISGQVGLQVCVTYRDDEIASEHPLAELAGSRIECIPIQSLSPKVTTEMVRSMLGLEELPVLLTERVQQTTGGNAFFVQELIRSLAEDGVVLQRTVKGWQIDRAALREARLPESIRQVVWRRLEQLPAEAQQVLRWAAIVGPVFWPGCVEAIGRVHRTQIQTALDEGMEQELVFERETSAFEGELEYMFANPTVREASYESVSRGERRYYHGQVAAWLVARENGKASEHLGLIADHLEKAGQVEEAVTYLTRAGEQAAEQFANVEAVDYFDRALDLMPKDDTPTGMAQRYALLLARERVHNVQGAREAQRRDLADLEELAQALDDARRQAEVALRQAHYADVTSNYSAAIAVAQDAIRLAQAAQDASSEAAGYLHWGGALRRQGKYEAAQRQLEQSLARARAAGTREVEVNSLRYLGLVAWNRGHYAEARAYQEQALHTYRELGNRPYEGGSLNNLGILFKNQGDYAEAVRYYEQALDIFHEIGERRGEAIVLVNLGEVSRVQGDYDEARAFYEQSWQIRHEIDDRNGESQALTNLGLLLHNLGDDEAAREYSQRAFSITQETGDRRWQGYALTNLGHALAGLERLAEAADVYRQALDIRRELGEQNLAIESLAGLARLFLIQEDLDQAQAAVEEILHYLDLEGATLDGTDEPFQVYLTCYRVLRAGQDPRAEDVLNTAYRLLKERSARITDENMQRSFLENVTAHREIVSEWASLS